MLFGFFIDGLEGFLAVVDGVVLPLLLYADDLMLKSHARSGLQDLLDSLHYVRSVNEKTNAVIFCRGIQPVVYNFGRTFSKRWPQSRLCAETKRIEP